jgi:23S rRNA pseudouridine955/2504/2580 synthase/23S rRNA pseudouridine1911/1915/1917 synthase
VIARGHLFPDLRSPVRKKRRFCAEGTRPPDRDGEFCETLFRGIRHRDGLSLVEATPITGRLHQIRATLLGLGYPVVGDKIYGPDDTLFIRFIEDRLTASDRTRLRLPRQALHAAGLAIRPPATMVSLVFDAPLPEDMASMIGRSSM